MFKQFIKQLCTDIGEEELPSTFDNRSCSLDFEPDLHVSLQEHPDAGIALFTLLAPLPEQRRGEFLLKAMAANLFGRETGGGVLGLDNEGKQVTFFTLLSGTLNYKAFHDSLEEFVNYAEAWKMEIVEDTEQPVDSSSSGRA